MRIPGPLIFLLLLSFPAASQTQIPIGQWRDHFSYRNSIAVVEGGGKAYSATRNAVFSYDDNTQEIERITKVNALSDVGVQTLGWNTERNALLVGYQNGNIDVIRGGSTLNIGDIKRSDVLGDKGVYCFLSEGPVVYVGCGFGIVVVNVDNGDIRETWLIGPNASQVQVNGLTVYQDSLFAATDKGLFSAWRHEPNLAAFTSWHKRTDIPNPNGPFTAVAAFSDRLFVNLRNGEQSDTLYAWNGGWSRMTELYNRTNRSVVVSADGQRMVVGHTGDVRGFNTALGIDLYASGIAGTPLNANAFAIREAGGVWIATQDQGLGRLAGGGVEDLHLPKGPKTASAIRMSTAGGHLMVVTGNVAGNWSNTFRQEGVHVYANGEWSTTDYTDDPLYNTGANTYGSTVNDVMAVVVDPDDPAHAYVGSWDEGIVDFRDGHVTGFYNNSNSSLQINAALGAENLIQVAGVDIDDEGNLWVTNSSCNAPISVRKKDGGWKAFAPGSILANNTLMADVLAASNGFKWIIRPRSQGMLVFDDGGTIDDTGDDHYQVISTFDGQGELPSMDVFSVAEDKDQQIWVGTGKGVAVFYDPNAMFTGGDFDCQQILIEQDGNVQILLETEAVSAIAVDGANRKWLGTQSSGVFLVSADGTQQVQHFTVENSPMPSNTVNDIDIDETTGEVFIATDQGIISYRGDATEGSDKATCANVFPNPVKPSYSGSVAITGLVQGSDVRVTDIAGNLVYHTTSLGGQAIWPATDMSGQRVSTGVYLILASDPTGESTCNTRVLVTR